MESAADEADDQKRFRRRRMARGSCEVAPSFRGVRLNRENNSGDSDRHAAEKRRQNVPNQVIGNVGGVAPTGRRVRIGRGRRGVRVRRPAIGAEVVVIFKRRRVERRLHSRRSVRTNRDAAKRAKTRVGGERISAFRAKHNEPRAVKWGKWEGRTTSQAAIEAVATLNFILLDAAEKSKSGGKKRKIINIATRKDARFLGFDVWLWRLAKRRENGQVG